jgi:glycolate oxidase iron-sulfur subunit
MSEKLTETLQQLDACIHCGMCLPACPTYRVTGSEAESPRGRLFLMKSFVNGELDSPQQLSDHLDPCLGCLGCMTACPSGVSYESLLLASRQKLNAAQPPLKRRIRRFLLTQLLPKPKRLAFLAHCLKLYQHSGLQTLIRHSGLLRLFGLLEMLEQFAPTIQTGQPLGTGQVYGINQKGRVALFTGCMMNTIYHETHRATIDVLTANGYEVVIPEQTCCGALAHHAGEEDIAASLAEVNIRLLMASQPDWIVVNAAGCGSTLKEYPHIASSGGEAFGAKVVDILELLAKDPLEGDLSPVPLTVTYHAACHLHHAQGIQQEPYAVLRQIPGLKLVPLVEAEMCCGSAGVYNLAHPELSLAILKEKMRHLMKVEADAVLAGNPGCILQLETGIRRLNLPMKVMHPIDIIAMAYRTPFDIALK